MSQRRQTAFSVLEVCQQQLVDDEMRQLLLSFQVDALEIDCKDLSFEEDDGSTVDVLLRQRWLGQVQS